MRESDPPDAGAGQEPPGRRQALVELAYERIEARLVNCSLAPGRRLTMNDLVQATGLGRTPVHQAVNRLAADTLVLVRPRHGLQIAPIDLARERRLLMLRRDLERFVVRLAAERLDGRQRDRLLAIERQLAAQRDGMGLDAFNRLDSAIDREIIAIAGEPFLESTLRPLHTIFRRIGHLHHSHRGGMVDLTATVARHVAILKAIADRDAARAVAASDDLMAYVDGMFDGLQATVGPDKLDSSAEPAAA